MICAPLAEPTLSQARRAMLTAAARADIVELRLDQLDELPDADGLAALLKDRPCPVIITNRPASEGGKSAWPDEVRLKVLQAAIELGADYVDVELGFADRLKRRPSTKIIVSYHNFTLTPLDLPAIYSRIVPARAPSGSRGGKVGGLHFVIDRVDRVPVGVVKGNNSGLQGLAEGIVKNV